MRVLVCGGRDYDNSEHIWKTLDDINQRTPIAVVIHGCAPGADTQGMIWAQTYGKKHAPFQADWHAHGKAAGPIRNKRMIDEGKPDMVVAFPGGKGTLNMKMQARKAGIPVVEVEP